ncbi:MAG: hypothetical protein KGN79_15270 [Acidobacteriota bacterium]|nr:hypothetical protein [Acidobacteriota bacterium]
MGNQKKPPFFQTGNDVVDVFQPIMGPHCFTVYCHLLRRRFKNPALKHSVRDLASSSGLSGATVLRSLEIIAHLGLIKLYRSGGGQASECKLLDSSEAATRLGAQFVGKSLSWELPTEICKRLHFEVKTIKQRQQGKAKTPNLLSYGSRPLPVSQRNAGVSPAIRQRATRETQAGTIYYKKKEEMKNALPLPLPTMAQRRKTKTLLMKMNRTG